jgi:NTP pyrophosphatase (non-canonical NTP hydrolase)
MLSTMSEREPMTLAEFQQLIRDRYFSTDSARGVSGTFLWFSEEIGELAEALGKHERGDGDQANLEEEFADVLAWLTTLANITGVDLAHAIERKYLHEGGPKGVK